MAHRLLNYWMCRGIVVWLCLVAIDDTQAADRTQSAQEFERIPIHTAYAKVRWTRLPVFASRSAAQRRLHLMLDTLHSALWHALAIPEVARSLQGENRATTWSKDRPWVVGVDSGRDALAFVSEGKYTMGNGVRRLEELVRFQIPGREYSLIHIEGLREGPVQKHPDMSIKTHYTFSSPIRYKGQRLEGVGRSSRMPVNPNSKTPIDTRLLLNGLQEDYILYDSDAGMIRTSSSEWSRVFNAAAQRSFRPAPDAQPLVDALLESLAFGVQRYTPTRIGALDFGLSLLGLSRD